MQFNTLPFFLFFAAVFLIFSVLPRKARCVWLLAASYVFCAFFSWFALGFIAASTLCSWLIGLAIQRSGPPRKKAFLVLGIVLHTGFLFFFKYFEFFLRNLNLLFLRTTQVQTFDTFTHLIVPVGISFYTFQILGYLIDIYRGKSPAEKNLLRYALFLAFFPKLIQGPIERSDNLLVQIRNLETLRAWDLDRISAGLTAFLWGLFQKMVLADRLSLFVNMIFDNYQSYGTVQLAAGSLGYTLQLYLDFSGYTCMALGIAQCFGFSLLENFNAPYLATSCGDFWRRWHMTLSGWFRDYLYIPLGGSRVSRLRRCFNILVTMLVSGLWHGASWNFVAWGLLHGIYQVAGVLTRPVRQWFNRKASVRTEAYSYRLGQHLFTFCLVSFAWIFFRANGLAAALHYVYRLFTRPNFWVLFDGTFSLGITGIELYVLLAGLLLVFAVDKMRFRRNLPFQTWLQDQNLWFRWSVCLVLLLTVLVFGEYGVDFDSTQFLYFNF